MKVSVPQTKALMEANGIFASKKYGQNFLVDNNIISLIAESVDYSSLIIEIGPGLGYLTDSLAERCDRLIAYEIDDKLIEILKDNLKNRQNINIENRDFMKVNLNEIKEEKYTVVSNLPYYITTDILIKLLKNYRHIDSMIVMMQKEVAEKIVKMSEVSVLTVLAHCLCDIQTVTNVSRNCYYPKPEVDSAVLKMKVRDEEMDVEGFYEFLTACFRQKRKLLISNLKNYGLDEEKLEKLGIRKDVRCENLSVEQFVELYEVLK